jgi:hypothetical protein
MSQSTTTSTEERALELLGQGIPNSMVASAIGVSESRISQLFSDPIFAEKLARIRYENLIRNSKRDEKADLLEDLLLDKLVATADFLMEPMKIAAIYAKVNAARRRGSSAPEAITAQQTVVSLVMPTTVINNFIKQNIQVDTNNQVIKAGNQELITVQSHKMDSLVKNRPTEPQHEQLTIENGTAKAG